jgi:hypothetical protein
MLLFYYLTLAQDKTVLNYILKFTHIAWVFSWALDGVLSRNAK